MKAVVYEKYGSPDVLKLEEVEKPVVQDDGVLVRVRAASVNPLDWHLMRGEPYIARMAFGLRKPKQRFLGVDLAGQVEAVGKNVTELHAGDEVFGAGQGALAEYVSTSQKSLVAKPSAVTFEQAAAVPVAARQVASGRLRCRLPSLSARW
jgi:NADPH:quinone reductase-like Zn-dependent oxidoreductase